MSAKQIYFIGIGGIGMSALAQHAQRLGYEVLGYDRSANDQTERLVQSGASITYEYDELSLIERLTPGSCVVRTAAVPMNHLHCKRALELNHVVMKRADLLSEFLEGMKPIAVAGTHGKTSTSSYIAHFLDAASTPFTAFLGGVSSAFGSNYIDKGSTYAVVEADEYDRSFLKLSPEISVITNIEVDHLDCYSDLDDLEQAFVQFQSQTHAQCIVHESLPKTFKGLRYGFSDGVDFRIIPKSADYSQYDLLTRLGTYSIRSNRIGRHNALNAVAAFAAAAQCCEPSSLLPAFESLPQIQRRFNVIVETERQLYIDDYAHHPSELEALHAFARAKAPDKTLTLVFQPHLYSRTLQLKADFIRALACFDQLIILPIYAAREQPDTAIDSRHLVEALSGRAVYCENDRLIEALQGLSELQVLITAGAGDISAYVEPIKQWMTDESVV